MENRKLRKRSLLWLPAAILLTALYQLAISAILAAPFGDEPGSVAFPMPNELGAVKPSAFAWALIGMGLLLADFLNWQRKKAYG